MRKKGFTLVELLAVIAILAILVIVAMPNVLGMFNEAKQNTFVTEVQKIMDSAKGEFTSDAFNKGGKTVYYSSTDNNVLGTSKLDIDAPDKEYFIEMDRNGEFKRVVIFDDNYCYDVYSNNGNSSIGVITTTQSKLMSDGIKKSSVVIDDVWESGGDGVEITYNGTNYFVGGCEGVVTVKGKDTNVQLETVKINGAEFNYVPGMTWEEWTNSEYNTAGYVARSYRIDIGSNSVKYGTPVYSGGTLIAYKQYANPAHQIINDEVYFLEEAWLSAATGDGLNVGDVYYDFTQNGGNVIFEQEKVVNSIPNFGGDSESWD